MPKVSHGSTALPEPLCSTINLDTLTHCTSPTGSQHLQPVQPGNNSDRGKVLLSSSFPVIKDEAGCGSVPSFQCSLPFFSHVSCPIFSTYHLHSLHLFPHSSHTPSESLLTQSRPSPPPNFYPTLTICPDHLSQHLTSFFLRHALLHLPSSIPPFFNFPHSYNSSFPAAFSNLCLLLMFLSVPLSLTHMNRALHENS